MFMSFYYNIENPVLPPGCRPCGPEVRPGQSKLAMPLKTCRSTGAVGVLDVIEPKVNKARFRQSITVITGSVNVFEQNKLR